MDTRKALKPGIEIHGKEKNTRYYTVRKEVGRGGTCIAYDAFYLDNQGFEIPVLLKECYPFELNIVRDERGFLIVKDEEKEKFVKHLERFEKAYKLNASIYVCERARDIALPDDYISANNTRYCITSPVEGNILSFEAITSFRDAILITRNVAKAILRVHNTGNLYLDIKPSNIWLSDNKEIQLFDFDAFVPFSDKGVQVGDNHRISFSKGFAPMEQQTGNFKAIGRWTDIYSIGALFYYLIFEKTPSSLESGGFIDYKYKTEIFKDKHYSNKLYSLLDDFFEKTLTPNYRKRYQTVSELLLKLDDIEKQSVEKTYFLKSSSIIPIRHFYGRKKEMCRLMDWYNSSSSPLIISGLGGIGKSTLVKQFICQLSNNCKNVYYLYFNKSIMETICDDDQLYVDSLCRWPGEKEQKYYHRKLAAIDKALEGEKSLFVIDNFEGDIDRDGIQLIGSSRRVILITRERKFDSRFDSIEIEEIDDDDCLFAIMKSSYNKEIKDGEIEAAKELIKKAYHNTLLIELLAKQAKCSHISLIELNKLLNEQQILSLNSGQVRYIRDDNCYYDSMSGLLREIFSVSKLDSYLRKILTILAIFAMPSANVKDLSEFLVGSSENVICEEVNLLADSGWIKTIDDGDVIEIHPLIREFVLNMDEADAKHELLQQCAELLSVYIHHIACKDQLPGRAATMISENSGQGIKENWLYKFTIKLEERMAKRRGVLGQLALERALTGEYNAPIDQAKLNRLFEYARAWYAYASSSEGVSSTSAYSSIVCNLALYLPIEREEEVLLFINESLKRDYRFSEIVFMNLIERSLDIYTCRKDYEMAEKVLSRAEQYAKMKKSGFSWGRYYDCLAYYYDNKLNGEYEDDSDLRNQLMDAVDRSIKYMKNAQNRMKLFERYRARVYYAKYLLSKAILLMRCGNGYSANDILQLIEMADTIIQNDTLKFSKERIYLTMTYAWYYSTVERNNSVLEQYANQAFEHAIVDNLSFSVVADDICIPLADIYRNLGIYTKAAMFLIYAIDYIEIATSINNQKADKSLCQKRKRELLSYLIDVYELSGESSKVENIKKMLNEDEQYID